jgi:hypothetical protein
MVTMSYDVSTATPADRRRLRPRRQDLSRLRAAGAEFRLRMLRRFHPRSDLRLRLLSGFDEIEDSQLRFYFVGSS